MEYEWLMAYEWHMNETVMENNEGFLLFYSSELFHDSSL